MEPRPFFDYPALVDLLEQRGMQLPDKKRAERKLSQVGYYRLSGFWYSCRNPHPVIPYKRLDAFFSRYKL